MIPNARKIRTTDSIPKTIGSTAEIQEDAAKYK